MRDEYDPMMDPAGPYRTDWPGVYLFFGLLISGVLCGAFIVAPWLFGDRLDFALRCWAASLTAFTFFILMFVVVLLLTLIDALRGRPFLGRRS